MYHYRQYEQMKKGDVVVHINSKDIKIVESSNALGTVLTNPDGVGRLFFSYEVKDVLHEQYRVLASNDTSIARVYNTILNKRDGNVAKHENTLTCEERSGLRKLLYQNIFRLEKFAYSMKCSEEDCKKALEEIERSYSTIGKLINIERQKAKENVYESLEHTS